MNVTKKDMGLPLMEEFLTIQGEGYHTGRGAYFIRLGGCDVGCVWCDVKESWNANDHPKVSVDHLVQNVIDTNIDFEDLSRRVPKLSMSS